MKDYAIYPSLRQTRAKTPTMNAKGFTSARLTNANVDASQMRMQTKLVQTLNRHLGNLASLGWQDFVASALQMSPSTLGNDFVISRIIE